jgi:hypothetical protein
MATSQTLQSKKAAGPDAPGFDASVLEALLDLGARERQLEEFRQKAEGRREAVSAAVYARVTADYEKRLAALRAEAAPLKRRVGTEYQKLKAIADRLKAKAETARLDKEELEFRRDLGEIDLPEFESKVAGPTAILDQCQGELDTLEQEGARFLEALGPDAHTSAEAAGEEIPQVSAPVPPKSGPSVSGVVAAADPAPLDAGGATVLVTPSDIAPALDATQYVSPDTYAADPGATAAAVMLPPDATLVLEEHGASTAFKVPPLTYIGRSDTNQVQLARAGVSRRHALISLAADGTYSIKDLQSQNGTLVNGHVIAETRLTDGDKVTIGDAELTFRAPRV